MEIFTPRDNLHEMSEPIWGEKSKENIVILSSAVFVH